MKKRKKGPLHGPFRKVALVLPRYGTGAHGGSYWLLTLECGHEVTRTMRPFRLAPKKARCFMCEKGHEKVPVRAEPGVNVPNG